MNRITLKHDGTLIHKGDTVKNDPSIFLGYAIELEDGCTLRSYFRLFENYEPLGRLNALFPSFIAQYRASPPSDCVYGGFDRLEFWKTVEMIGFPGKPRLEIYNSLLGMDETRACEIREVQLENLLDMPLKLGRLKHIVFGDKVDVFEFDTVFNVFEFIDGIVWELSFQGTLTACELRR